MNVLTKLFSSPYDLTNYFSKHFKVKIEMTTKALESIREFVDHKSRELGRKSPN